jgi:hypothetical protein
MEYLKAEGINYAGTIPKIKKSETSQIIKPCSRIYDFYFLKIINTLKF